MKPSLDSDEEEEIGTYQKKLRERANRSIQQLSNMLVNQSSEAEALEQSRGQLSPPPQCSRLQTQPSEAVSQLRSLLQKPHKEDNSPSPSKRKHVSKKQADEDDESLPVQDLVPIIHNQSEYIQHLEAEVKFCKEELLAMKQRVGVVVVENEKLREEIKAKMVEDTLKEYTLLDSTVHAEMSRDKMTSTPAPKPTREFISKTDDKKWEKELEQLKCLYQAQCETLEAQVVSLKKDLVNAQTECEELKERLRHKEAIASVSVAGQRVGGLCLKCAQHEAVLAETHSNIHIQAIERLTKERDELMAALCSLRASQSEVQQREWAAYHQVKQAVEMAEEANLEKTKAQVQCNHICAELARQRERLEKELALEHMNIAQAKDEARAESKKDKEELVQRLTTLTCRVAEVEGLLDRGVRERNSLNIQLEEAFKKLTAQETDNSRVCGELRYQVSQAQLKREEAERELRNFRSKLGRELELAQQEVQKLGAELSGSQQRLEEAQRAEGRARTEAAGLAEGLNRAQRQLHLTRKEKEALERRCAEDVAALTFQAQRREHELTQTLQQMEAQHEKNVADMDILLSLQNGLIGKLKEECHTICSKMEELSHSNRAEVEQLTSVMEHLQESVEKLRGRCHEMEEQCVQHGRMHQRMQHRLQQLDQHSQSSAQQVMELLSRQNQLIHERQLLTEELHSLRAHLPTERSETIGTA